MLGKTAGLDTEGPGSHQGHSRKKDISFILKKASPTSAVSCSYYSAFPFIAHPQEKGLYSLCNFMSETS